MEVTEASVVEALEEDPTLTVEFRQRCYSLYLWGYTMSVSGGAVNFDLDDDFVKQHGWKASLIFQQSVARGVFRGQRPYEAAAPMEPAYFGEFDSGFAGLIADSSLPPP